MSCVDRGRPFDGCVAACVEDDQQERAFLGRSSLVRLLLSIVDGSFGYVRIDA
jgi:hypothetical protein